MDDDEADFRAFVSTRWSALVSTAYLITTDRGVAEDCVQEAMARVHRHWRRVRQDGKPAAYAHQAVVNAALSWRRRRRIREVPLTPFDQSSRAAAEQVDQSIDGVDPALLTALRSLPPQMRAAVALRYLEDRSEAETARLLGCTVGTVKSSTSRGVARLRTALAASEGRVDGRSGSSPGLAPGEPLGRPLQRTADSPALANPAGSTAVFPEGAR
jgi:RNA polymerase sigma-70 factor (sigma-E family)